MAARGLRVPSTALQNRRGRIAAAIAALPASGGLASGKGCVIGRDAAPASSLPITKRTRMRGYNGGSLSDRLGTAEAARKAQLERFRSRPGSDDPAVQKRQAERQAIVEAREARNREREEKRRAEEAKLAEIKRAADESAKAEQAAREAAAEVERRALEADRPRQAIRDAAMYAKARAAGSRR